MKNVGTRTSDGSSNKHESCKDEKNGSDDEDDNKDSNQRQLQQQSNNTNTNISTNTNTNTTHNNANNNQQQTTTIITVTNFTPPPSQPPHHHRRTCFGLPLVLTMRSTVRLSATMVMSPAEEEKGYTGIGVDKARFAVRR